MIGQLSIQHYLMSEQKKSHSMINDLPQGFNANFRPFKKTNILLEGDIDSVLYK